MFVNNSSTKSSYHFVTSLDAHMVSITKPPLNIAVQRGFFTVCSINMTYQEAVDLAGTLRPDLTGPGHYDMFKHNSEDPQKFADYFSLKYPGLKYWIGNHYEEVRFSEL
jgi:hypothetical protein